MTESFDGYFYSPSTKAFYDSRIISIGDIPVDAVKVARTEHAHLMAQVGRGRTISYQDGRLIAIYLHKKTEVFNSIRDHLLASAHTIMTTKAVEFGYSCLEEVVSYAEEPSDEQFEVEGRAFRFWRSQVRRACINIAHEIHLKGGFTPRVNQLETMLPKFDLSNGLVNAPEL